MLKFLENKEKIKKKILNLKREKRKITLAHGVFDLIHLGHLQKILFLKVHISYLNLLYT